MSSSSSSLTLQPADMVSEPLDRDDSGYESAAAKAAAKAAAVMSREYSDDSLDMAESRDRAAPSRESSGNSDSASPALVVKRAVFTVHLGAGVDVELGNLAADDKASRCVVTWFGGSPHESHAMVGDVLLAVNGQSVAGMCASSAAVLLDTARSEAHPRRALKLMRDFQLESGGSDIRRRSNPVKVLVSSNTVPLTVPLSPVTDPLGAPRTPTPDHPSDGDFGEVFGAGVDGPSTPNTPTLGSVQGTPTLTPSHPLGRRRPLKHGPRPVHGGDMHAVATTAATLPNAGYSRALSHSTSLDGLDADGETRKPWTGLSSGPGRDTVSGSTLRLTALVLANRENETSSDQYTSYHVVDSTMASPLQSAASSLMGSPAGSPVSARRRSSVASNRRRRSVGNSPESGRRRSSSSVISSSVSTGSLPPYHPREYLGDPEPRADGRDGRDGRRRTASMTLLGISHALEEEGESPVAFAPADPASVSSLSAASISAPTLFAPSPADRGRAEDGALSAASDTAVAAMDDSSLGRSPSPGDGDQSAGAVGGAARPTSPWDRPMILTARPRAKTAPKHHGPPAAGGGLVLEAVRPKRAQSVGTGRPDSLSNPASGTITEQEDLLGLGGDGRDGVPPSPPCQRRRSSPCILLHLEFRLQLFGQIKMFHFNEARRSPKVRRASCPASALDLDAIRQMRERAENADNGGSAPVSTPGSPKLRRFSRSDSPAEDDDADQLLGRAVDDDPNLKRALANLIRTVSDWGALTPRERWQHTIEIVSSVLFLRRRYPWFQLAGHSGQFEQHHSPEWVLKMVSEYESKAFGAMQGDPMAAFTPIYKGIVTKGGKKFFQLQNLLFGFTEPCGMDCKMGFRTYLAKDVKSRKARMDLLAKLEKLDPSTVTNEERINGVTKRRYMQHREVMSSTATLGFRIEAVKMGKNDAKTFKGGTLIDRSAVADELNGFMGGNSLIRNQYLAKLRQLRAALVSSDFFKRHEVVGSSLLLLHDRHCEVGLWMIDFGKTVEVDRELDHLKFSEDNLDEHEDGYLLGLDNLMSIIERCG